MTLSLAPSPLPGSAPPANAPPGPGSVRPATSKAGDRSAPSAFAALLQAVKAGQGGGETALPTGGTPSHPEALPGAEELLAQLMALMQEPTTPGDAAGPTDQRDANPLLDRLAEAGNPTDGPSGQQAAEALMVYLVMAQRREATPDTIPALPADVLARLAGARPDVASASGAMPLTSDEAIPGGGQAMASGVGQAGSEDLLPGQSPRMTSMADAGDLNSGDAESGEQPMAVAPDASMKGSGTALTAPATGSSEDGAPTDLRPADGTVMTTASSTAASASASGASSDQLVGVTSAGNAVDGLANALAGVTAPQSNPAPRVETVVSARVMDAASLPAEVADTVQIAALRGDSEIRLVLNPPDLGHLDIRIASGDGGLRITMEASQSGARELLDRSLLQLQQALEARDLRVDRLEVRAADTGRGMDSSTGQQPGGSGESDGRDGTPEWSPLARLAGGLDADTMTDGPATPAQSTAADGRVDVLA